jgi:two-component system C4-dicarboxylate transport response regulator DctD
MADLIDKSDIKIIIVDDDEDIRINTVDLLLTKFKRVEAFSSPKKIIHKISLGLPVVILTDLRMPDADGFEFAKKIHDIDPDLPVILMTGYGDISIAVDALKHGIYDFIEKPFEIDRLMDSLHRAVEKRMLTLSLLNMQQKLDDNRNIEHQLIGFCPGMKQLKRDIVDLAPMDIPVMIYGETGSGKEMAARCLHNYSNRSEANFVPLNCAAIPEQLAEAELFGYKKGAFTDAKNSRIGKLEFAKDGTLFLDEVESLSLATQAKLLRALSDNVITPLGSNQEIRINCRIISATKDDLRNNEKFRQDLFFRLQVAEIKIPPLRERKEDIVHLFEVFSLQNCKTLGTNYRSITPYSLEKLLAYSWPGNVRELINVTTRYAIKHCSDIDYALESEETIVNLSDGRKTLKELVENYESSVIKLKLHEHKGKVGKVLDELSLERRTFNQKLNKYGINTSDFKSKS